MQKYKKLHEFTKKTIEQCRNKGNPKSVNIFLFIDQHCVTVVKTKIQLDQNSNSYRTRKKMEYHFLVNQFFFSFNSKRSWLKLSAFSQEDANKIRHLFSEWTLLNVKLHCIILTYNVLQHKKKPQGIFYLINMLHGCWTMEVQPFSQRVNLQCLFFFNVFFLCISQNLRSWSSGGICDNRCVQSASWSQQLQTLLASNLLLVYIFVYI